MALDQENRFSASENPPVAVASGVTGELRDRLVPVGALQQMAEGCVDDAMKERLLSLAGSLEGEGIERVTLGKIVGSIANQMRENVLRIDVEVHLSPLRDAMARACGLNNKQELTETFRVAVASHAPIAKGERP